MKKLLLITIAIFPLLIKAQQTQQVVFVAGDDPATPEIYIQDGQTAYMYIQGGISAVNTLSPIVESNIVSGTFTGTGTGNIVVDGGLFINTNAGIPGDVRNATNAPFVFSYDKSTIPSGAELTGTPMPSVLGTASGNTTNATLATWGGTVHMMSGQQRFAGKDAQPFSDMVFYNLSLEGDAIKTIIGSVSSTTNDNLDLGDVETGVGGTGAALNKGTLFLNGSILATQDNLVWARNSTSDDASATVQGSAIARVASGSGGAGASNAWGMSLTSQNALATTKGYVTSTNSTRGRLGRTTTSGEYLFPVADESGFYRPTGIIGAGAGTYFSRVQQTSGTALGSATPSSILEAFYNVVNTSPAALSGEYRLYATLDDINNNDVSAGSPPCTSTDVFTTAAPNMGTAQSEAVANTWGFQQGTISAPAGSADLSYTTSVSYPTTPLPGAGSGCSTLSGPRVAFKARPTAGSATDVEESYVVATKPWIVGDLCFNSTLVPCANPLPVELISFTGNIEGANDHLYWNTAVEQNIESYELQYSTDAISFKSLGSKRALNANANNYDMVNTKPVIGRNYYRLQINETGTTVKYSNIVVLDRRSKKIQIASVNPNPSNGNITVGIASPIDNVAVVTLFDLNGKQIFSESHNLVEGYNQFQLNLSSLASSMDMLQVESNNQISSAKIVKE